MQKLILGIIGSIFIFSGCANKDLAKHYLQEGNVTKAYAIYSKWKYRGDVNSALNMAKLESDEAKKFKLAKYLFNHHNNYGANMLENFYYNKGDLKKARFYYERSDLNNSNQKDFYTHLSVIMTFRAITKQKKELEKIEKIAENNIFAAHALGRFYENENNYFYDINKSLYFYKKAYEKKYIQSGINLAKLYLYKLNDEKKGINLLKEIMSSDSQSAYILANYLLIKLNKNIIKLNTPCITCTFKKPAEFFYRKLYLIKYRDAFIRKNIKPFVEYAYKNGYLDAKLLLIRLDVKYDNFSNKSSYSGFSLNQAIDFLNVLSDDNFKAKLLLADIYYKYDFLNQFPLAEKIYFEYAKFDKINAYWHLYQYYKKYEPSKRLYYLNYLVKYNFLPAIIEQAYLNKDIKILYKYYKMNNILALKYYISLMVNKTTSYSQKCNLYKELCKYIPLDKTTDLKIANLYELQKDYVKAATIYKFYSDLNDSFASYKLALIYKQLCSFDKYVSFFKKAQKEGNEKIKLEYAVNVIKGEINDKDKKYFDYINSLANTNNPKVLSNLAYLYSHGIYADFSPKKAELYYKKLINLGYKRYIYNLIDLYKKINFKHKYDNKIITLYKLAIKNNLPESSINLASFYISIENYKKAIKLLKKNIRKPKAKYLLYKITGKFYYLHNNINTNYGKLLLAYAKKIGKYNPYKALLYSFRAARCNTSGAILFSYDMMKRINNAKVIKRIYQKAKTYPICEN